MPDKTPDAGRGRGGPPDFAFVLPVEQVLPARPLRHHELQRWLPGRPGEAAEKLQQGLQLGVHQVGEDHDQGLGAKGHELRPETPGGRLATRS